MIHCAFDGPEADPDIAVNVVDSAPIAALDQKSLRTPACGTKGISNGDVSYVSRSGVEIGEVIAPAKVLNAVTSWVADSIIDPGGIWASNMCMQDACRPLKKLPYRICGANNHVVFCPWKTCPQWALPPAPVLTSTDGIGIPVVKDYYLVNEVQ